MRSYKVALIDLSIIFRRHWHATENEEVGEAFSRTINDVKEFIESADYAAVCLDSPPYKRSEIYPEYKAQREKTSSMMYGQLNKVKERLVADGHLLLESKGYEADDIIATATEKLSVDGHRVVVCSGDKDLLQLVSDKVVVVSTSTGAVMGFDEVEGKFGVPPELVGDLLALCGDKSDNIPGVAGVGPKTAAKWLIAHKNLAGVYSAVLSGETVVSDRFRNLIADGWDDLQKSRQLVDLMTDAPIDVDSIFEARETKPLVEGPSFADGGEQMSLALVREETPPQEAIMPDENHSKLKRNSNEAHTQGPGSSDTLPAIQPNPTRSIVTNNVANWERSLEPNNIGEAWKLAHHLYNSRLFGQFQSADAILSIILTGRAMGLDAATSLRGFHVIKGKVSPSAATLVGLIKRAQCCEYFYLEDSSDTSATYVTKRRGEPDQTRISYSLKDAEAAGLLGNDNWKKRPATMLRWRCSTELARAVYPDITAGLYTEDEITEM